MPRAFAVRRFTTKWNPVAPGQLGGLFARMPGQALRPLCMLDMA